MKKQKYFVVVTYSLAGGNTLDLDLKAIQVLKATFVIVGGAKSPTELK